MKQLLTGLLLLLCAGAQALPPPFDPALSPIGYLGQPGNAGAFLNGGTTLFSPDYNPANWSGNLHAFAVNAQGQVATTDSWSGGAAAALDAAAPGQRVIVTNRYTSGLPFRWDRLNADEQAALGSADLLDYLRGDRSREAARGGPFRDRDSVLGDILHSTPVHHDYGEGQPKTVFVGANDGMLHAFDAETGAERFAFVPSTLFSSLGQYANPNYRHRPYVDGQLVVGQVDADTVVLLGALGGGGRMLFALDVTNPTPSEDDAATLVRWTVDNQTPGYENLGQIYGRLLPAAVVNRGPTLITGNGYNNTGNGHATLMLINPKTGYRYAEMDTGVGSSTTPNGLSSPVAIDTDSDGLADTVYAGDIAGNLWRFDLTRLNSQPTLLFTAEAGQAITTAPVVARHPDGGYLVIFGTGRAFTGEDLSDTTVQALYGIWDDGGRSVDAGDLLEQVLTEQTYAGTDSIRVRLGTDRQPSWASEGHKGWKINLPGGERVLGDGITLSGGAVMLLTHNPTVNPEGSAPGENWWLQLDALTGGATGQIRFDLDGDRHFTASDLVDGDVPVGRHIGGGVRAQLLPFVGEAYLAMLGPVTFTNAATSEAPAPEIPPEEAGPGVAGGHFDFDIYYGTDNDTGFANRKHTHEYDDKYDVVGVDMRNASDSSFNLSNVPTIAPGVRFKALVMNQYLNPAASLKIGPGGEFVPVRQFQAQAQTSTAADVLIKAPTYTTDSLGDMVFKLPVDAFVAKDWWGDGDSPRAGLIPTQTGCVNKVDEEGYPTKSAQDGPHGEHHNGALTIQLIDADTPATALELNNTDASLPYAERIKYGWRVRRGSDFRHYVLAEYTVFWHHDNKQCYGDAEWTATPEPMNGGDSKGGTPVPDSGDPRGQLGTFETGDAPNSTYEDPAQDEHDHEDEHDDKDKKKKKKGKKGDKHDHEDEHESDDHESEHHSNEQEHDSHDHEKEHGSDDSTDEGIHWADGAGGITVGGAVSDDGQVDPQGLLAPHSLKLGRLNWRELID